MLSTKKRTLAFCSKTSALIVFIAIATSACVPKDSSAASIARPKTNATTNDGFNPQLQSAARTDASSVATATGADDIVGTSSTEGEFVLNFTIADAGRNLNFQTVQASEDAGFDFQTYSGRYQYSLDSKCIDTNCLEVVVMLSETDSTTSKSYQAVYVINDSGSGYQVVTTKQATSYDYIDDAVAGVIYGPPAP